jgi:uncharacterized membrane protein
MYLVYLFSNQTQYTPEIKQKNNYNIIFIIELVIIYLSIYLVIKIVIYKIFNNFLFNQWILFISF